MKLKSQAPLLISCPLPLVPLAQQPAGSFPERTASLFSFQQLCPPDFPMPDIRKRQGVEQMAFPSFAPAWLTSCFGWNRPLIYGPVPAENVSGRRQKRMEATLRIRKTSSSEAARPYFFSMTRFQSALIGLRYPPAACLQLHRRNGGADYRRKSIIG
jgi:hypothetical protein